LGILESVEFFLGELVLVGPGGDADFAAVDVVFDVVNVAALDEIRHLRIGDHWKLLHIIDAPYHPTASRQEIGRLGLDNYDKRTDLPVGFQSGPSAVRPAYQENPSLEVINDQELARKARAGKPRSIMKYRKNRPLKDSYECLSSRWL
jgi:hypothetical protein